MNTSENKIFPIRVGYSNAVLIVNGANSILIDTGVKNHIQQIKSLFLQHQLKPTDIQLIILTHTHYDHTGNLHELVELTNAKVIVHKNEFDNLKKGFTPIPKGLGFYTRIVSGIGRVVYPKYASPKALTADIINDDEMDLKPFGVDGKIISTPGHTLGSQSVLLGNKLISGDTFINLPQGIIFPHFADHPKMLLETWQKLFEMGIKEIYPGHGKKLTVEETFPEFEKWRKKILSSNNG